MSKNFCVTCDICTGGIYTRIEVAVEYIFAVIFSLGLYIPYNAFRKKCPKCGHKMRFHRGQPDYWKKKKK